MKRIIFLTAIFFVLGLTISGQTPSPLPDKGYSDSDDQTVKSVPETKSNEKAATLDELKAKAKSAKLKDDLIFAYDKFTDTSIVMAKPDNLVGSWEGAAAIMASSPMGSGSPGTPRILMVSVESRFDTQTLRETPDKFALVFDGMSPDWQFLKTGSTLYLLLDGNDRIRLEAAATGQDVKRWNRVDEKIAYVITRDELVKVCKAGKVEIRIGDGKPREFKPKLRKRWASLLEITRLEPEK